MGDTATVVPDGTGKREGLVGFRLSQNVIPSCKPHQREHRHCAEELNSRELLYLFDPHVSHYPPRAVERQRTLALHGRRGPQEVNVVRVIQRGIEALRVALGDVGFVHFCGADVGERGILVPAHPEVNVAGHMHQVTRARHQISQTIRSKLRLCRIGRRLQCMDVQVKREGMIGVCLHDRLKARNHRLRIRLGFPVRTPIIPGHGIH